MTTDFKLSKGSLPLMTFTFTDATGTVVDLTGATLQFRFQGPVTFSRNAEAVNAAAGTAQYQMVAGDTDVPGFYQAQWILIKAGVETAYPVASLNDNSTDGEYFTFEIVETIPITAVNGTTLIRDLYEPVRAILGDFKRRQYEDESIASVVRSCIRMGKLENYAVTADNRAITPSIESATDFAILVLNAAKMFVMPNAAAYSYRLRSMGESFGEQRHFVFELENQLYEASGGRTFQSFQTFYNWIHATAGVNIWYALTDMQTNAPVARITMGIGGVQVTKS